MLDVNVYSELVSDDFFFRVHSDRPGLEKEPEHVDCQLPFLAEVEEAFESGFWATGESCRPTPRGVQFWADLRERNQNTGHDNTYPRHILVEIVADVADTSVEASPDSQ